MSPVARDICQILLDHHRRVTSLPRRPNYPGYLITYGVLCEAAGVPEITRSVGVPLGEVAQWCADNGWPPLNSLAVNADTYEPGEGYENATGCSTTGWFAEVEQCLSCTQYPATVTT